MVEKKALENNSYPKAWEHTETLDNGVTVQFRPILPEDEVLYKTFMQKSTCDDIRHRFLSSMKEIPADLLFRFTHVDYNKAMAFVAIDAKNGELLGVSRYATDLASPRAEYAVMTRSDIKGHGIGFELMQMLIEYARSREVPELYGQIMYDSPEMIKMCKELGFRVVSDKDDRCYLMTNLVLSKK